MHMKKFNDAQPAPAASRFRILARNAALLAPFVASGALAQEAGAASQLATSAKDQMTGIVVLLVAILMVGIGISVLFFANKNTKRGVKQSG